jgi:hypothetical protein
VRLFGGATVFVAGVAVATVTGATGIGAVAGGALATLGFDEAVAGAQQLVSGQDVDSLASRALQTAGLPRDAANIAVAGTTLAGTLIAGSRVAIAMAARHETVAARLAADVQRSLKSYNEVLKTGPVVPTEAGIMTRSAFDTLAKDVKMRGFTDPVVRYTRVDGVNYVVQGNNRLAVARKLNRQDELKFEEVDLPYAGFKDEKDVVDAAAEAAARMRESTLGTGP